MQILRVGIALALITAANLHDKLAVLRELQELVIGKRLDSWQAIRGAIVTAKPYETLVVDIDAVLALRPFITLAIAAPGLDVIARAIEHDHRRRSHRRLLRLERPRPVKDPDIIPCINRNARGISELPLGGHLGPCMIHLEHRQG